MSAKVFTGRPRTSVTTSKVRSPARYAGESGRETPITAAGRSGPMPTSPTRSTMSSGFCTSTSRGTTSTSTCSPSRNTLSDSSLLGLCTMMRWSSAYVEMRSPLTASTRSPWWSLPSAGWPGSTTPTIGGAKRVSPTKTAK